MDMHSLELDVSCYATAVYHEVNTRTLEEKVGVINVIRNRVNSGRWGSDVCSVVYAHGQFIGVTDERHPEVDERSYLETKLLVLDTVVFNKYTNPVGKALYFHDDSIQSMGHVWGKKMVKIGR
ncbi:cell wall hydrolase, partial [bacterium]|nr:cell wall hydrolase [bacterium]